MSENNNQYKGVYEAVDSKGNVVKGRYVLRIVQTVNGVTHRDTKTISAPNKQKAYDQKIKIADELRAQYENGGAKPTMMSFADLVDKWKLVIETKMQKQDKKALSYDTYETYKSTLKNYLLPYFGDMPIKNISKGTIQLYLDYINSNYSLSSKTIYNQFSLLSSILNFAYQRDFILFNPCDKVEIDKPEEPNIQYFTDQQLSKIIVELDKMVEVRKDQLYHSIRLKKLSDEERDKKEKLILLSLFQKRLFILFCIVTGSRRGEALALRWTDLNLEDCAYVEFKGTNYNEKGKGAQYKGSLKNHSSLKRVYLDNHVIPYIKALKRLQSEVIKQQGWKNTGYVFLATKDGDNVKAGNLANGDVFTKWFKGWCKRNKEALGLSDEEVEEAHVHMLRHSSISYLINNNTDIKTTAEIAGHRDTNMTERYAHSYDKNKIEASKLFGDLFTE